MAMGHQRKQRGVQVRANEMKTFPREREREDVGFCETFLCREAAHKQSSCNIANVLGCHFYGFESHLHFGVGASLTFYSNISSKMHVIAKRWTFRKREGIQHIGKAIIFINSLSTQSDTHWKCIKCSVFR